MGTSGEVNSGSEKSRSRPAVTTATAGAGACPAAARGPANCVPRAGRAGTPPGVPFPHRRPRRPRGPAARRRSACRRRRRWAGSVRRAGRRRPAWTPCWPAASPDRPRRLGVGVRLGQLAEAPLAVRPLPPPGSLVTGAWAAVSSVTGNRRRMRAVWHGAIAWVTVSSSSTTASGSDPIAEAAPLSLCAREPHVPADRLVAEMVPPPRFDAVRFATYIPDPNQPSQTEAVRRPGVLRGRARRRARRGRRPGGGFVRLRQGQRPRPRPGPAASTSTAGTASARPTCSPRCGTRPRPSPRSRRSAPSWS